MGLFDRLRKKDKRRRVFVLGIDGTPYTFIQQQIEKGNFPNLERLTRNGSLRRMNSVVPCISSVAWTSFMTGVNLAKHNLQGFVDRKPNPFSMFIPTSKQIAVPTISEILSDAGKRVVSINVPVSFPPKEVNGVQISCFLATDLEKAVYPVSLVPELKEAGYRIDVDAWAGRKDKEKFLKDIHYTFERRVATANQLMESEDWDFFQLHIMETDRINHFLWEQWENGDPRLAPEFERFYRRVDNLIGELDEKLGDDIEFIVLSDHGFCTIKKEVYLNYWLEQQGYLSYQTDEPKNVKDMHPDTKAYSLIPGRIFINLKGREEKGTVLPGEEYEAVRNELIERLPTMTDPDTGEKIVRKVLKREEVYEGPYFENAPDLIVLPFDGFDLKGNVKQPALTYKGELVGMHTDDDASFFIRNRQVRPENNEFGIVDCLPTILDLMEISPPEAENFDGKSILK